MEIRDSVRKDWLALIELLPPKGSETFNFYLGRAFARGLIYQEELECFTILRRHLWSVELQVVTRAK